MTERNLMDLDVRDVRDSVRVLEMLFHGCKGDEIAEELGIDRSSVSLKIHRLFETREFQNALTGEWINQYRIMRDTDPKLAFTQLTRLVSQCLVKRFETEQNVNVTQRHELIIVAIRNYDAQLEAELKRTLPVDGARKPLDSPPAASEASRIPVT